MYSMKLEADEIILTVAQAAEILKVTESTINRYRRRGLLPYRKPVKKVYIRYSELLTFLGNMISNNDDPVS